VGDRELAGVKVRVTASRAGYVTVVKTVKLPAAVIA